MMPVFLKCTRSDGTEVFINFSQVEEMHRKGNKTSIWIGEEEYVVDETPEQIVIKIRSYTMTYVGGK